jgi:hypothetical protein
MFDLTMGHYFFSSHTWVKILLSMSSPAQTLYSIGYRTHTGAKRKGETDLTEVCTMKKMQVHENTTGVT